MIIESKALTYQAQHGLALANLSGCILFAILSTWTPATLTFLQFLDCIFTFLPYHVVVLILLLKTH